MMYRPLLFLCLIITSTDGAHKYAHLDSQDDLDKVRVCEVEGYIDRDTFQLHGNLYNCSTPPMSCSIPFHEGFDKNKRNVECRVPTDSNFFYNDHACSFRFFYRTAYCTDEMRCYSIVLTCWPIFSPKLLFWICFSAFMILVVFCLWAIAYRIYDKCYRVHRYPLPHEDLRRIDVDDYEIQELNVNFDMGSKV
ncbi:unnamed protein product [Caenorhabditis brenneri]